MAYFLDAELAQLVQDEQRGGGTSTKSFRPSSGGGTSSGRTNKFPAPCIKCGRRVEANKGSLAKVNNAWVTEHLTKADCG